MGRRFLGLVLVLSVVMIAVGCGPKRPAFLPDTFPTTVKVVDGGAGIEGVTVTLYRTEPLPNVTVYGVTDASGVAKIASMAGGNNFDGAPAGEYTVTCNKKIEGAIPNELVAGPGDSPEVIQQKSEQMKALKDERRVVPEILETQANSPMKMTVDTKGDLTIDIAEHK